jgi:hypothetical protein
MQECNVHPAAYPPWLELSTRRDRGHTGPPVRRQSDPQSVRSRSPGNRRASAFGYARRPRRRETSASTRAQGIGSSRTPASAEEVRGYLLTPLGVRRCEISRQAWLDARRTRLKPLWCKAGDRQMRPPQTLPGGERRTACQSPRTGADIGEHIGTPILYRTTLPTRSLTHDRCLGVKVAGSQVLSRRQWLSCCPRAEASLDESSHSKVTAEQAIGSRPIES